MVSCTVYKAWEQTTADDDIVCVMYVRECMIEYALYTVVGQRSESKKKFPVGIMKCILSYVTILSYRKI